MAPGVRAAIPQCPFQLSGGVECTFFFHKEKSNGFHGARIKKKDGQRGKEPWKETFLVQHLGRKQSASMSATSLPSQCDFEASGFCTGQDVKWSLLQLWNMDPSADTFCLVARQFSRVLGRVLCTNLPYVKAWEQDKLSSFFL